MKRSAATIVREYGPFPDVTHVHGVSYDGANIWIATGDTLNAIDTASGKTVRTLDVPAHAGTAFDGRHLYQISGDRIQKVDPTTGHVVATIPTPDGGASGMAWAEGSLWVGQHRKRKIHQVDPQTGAILRTIESRCARHRARKIWTPPTLAKVGKVLFGGVKFRCAMSAFGHKPTCAQLRAMSGLSPISDVDRE